MPRPQPDDTPQEYPRLGPLRHSGPCGRRVRCHRADCRQRFGPYATVEILRSGIVLYRCHGVRTVVDDLTLEMLAA
jgi:hypothetical protein